MIKLTVIEEYYFCLYPWISFHKDWNSNVNCEQTDPTNLQQFHHNTVAEKDTVGMYGKCSKANLKNTFVSPYPILFYWYGLVGWKIFFFLKLDTH